MGDKVTIEIEGVEKCIENLKAWQVIKKEAVKIALKEIGFKTEGDAKKLCTVDTGRLRASITTNWSGSPMARTPASGDVTTGKKSGRSPDQKADDGIGRPGGIPNMVVVVGTNVEYGSYVEWGTKKMAAKPYLLPAKQQNEKELESRLKKIFKK